MKVDSQGSILFLERPSRRLIHMAYSADCTDFFAQNTDITGIGVRVGFYLQVNVLREWAYISDLFVYTMTLARMSVMTI